MSDETTIYTLTIRGKLVSINAVVNGGGVMPDGYAAVHFEQPVVVGGSNVKTLAAEGADLPAAMKKLIETMSGARGEGTYRSDLLVSEADAIALAPMLFRQVEVECRFRVIPQTGPEKVAEQPEGDGGTEKQPVLQ